MDNVTYHGNTYLDDSEGVYRNFVQVFRNGVKAERLIFQDESEQEIHAIINSTL
jgi:hypothetical protein